MTRTFEPAQLGPLRLKNRIIKAATFEGLTPRGQIGEGIVDFHRAFAAGGVAMTTLAYCAVADDGRGVPHEIVLGPGSVEGLRAIADAVHAEGAAVSAQIGHAGPVAQSRVTKSKALAASSGFSPLGTRFHEMSPDEIKRTIANFANGASVLKEAGFDAVELHMGHHYLLNSFLSPKFNRRTDEWGGSVENRARICREVATAVRERVGSDLAVIAKLEMMDGVRGGLWLDDSIEVARLLEADGALDALELTGGGSLANPMFLFRGDAPREEFAKTLPKALRLGFRVVGKRFMPEYPFEEAYFFAPARQFREALSLPLILLGGINRLETMERAFAEGFSFVALGRALLRDPAFVSKLEKGTATESLCIHCNKCVPTIYRGTHCVLVAPEDRPGVRVI